MQETDSKDATVQPRIRAGEVSGRRGKAIAPGPLSVPVSWSTTAPRIQTASPLSAAANRTANAAVGADGATITNVAGTLTVTTRRYPQLRLCNGAPPRS
ncbi:hypothetical protein A5714_17275 [Mycobacterium sp. E2462]|nr:hypothetical protein A5714_17275 [Mycobacterium sp. E2462]